MKKLIFIIQKNFRLIFRNWITFALLILGPLVLILIAGFAFSGNQLHNIFIGVHTQSHEAIQPVVGALASNEITIVYFPAIQDCIYALNHSAINICADFSPDFKNGTGSIIFYYDITKYNLVRYILEYLKNQVALTSEEISLHATEEIFSDINMFIIDMQKGKQQVNELKTNSLLLKQDLVDAHSDIVFAQEKFIGPYMAIKDFQSQLNETLVSFSGRYIETTENLTTDTLLANLSAIERMLLDLNTTLYAAETFIAAGDDAEIIYNNSLIYNNHLFDETHASLDIAHAQLQLLGSVINSTPKNDSFLFTQTLALLNHTNEIISNLDKINASLAETEQKLANHIINIDLAVTNLGGLSDSFDAYIASFSAINQSTAEQFLHPIIAIFKTLPEKQPTKTALVFPILLVFMLSFISILLSNMIVLNETHSLAYFRNFLVPVSQIYFIFGIFITNILLVCLQLFVFFLVAYLSFGINFFMNLPIFLLSVVITVVLFVLIGMFFGYLVYEQQTSILFSLFFALIMFFFSDIIFPLEIMPPIAGFLAQFNPFVVAEDIFRRILFFGHNVQELWFGFGVLCLYILFFSMLVVLAYYYKKQKTI